MAEVSVSSAWSTAYPSETLKLVDKVARLYGLQGDADARVIAMDALDDSVKDMNNHLYEFNVVEEAGLALPSDGTVQPSSQVFKEKLAYLVRNSDDGALDPLTYLDYAAFKRLYPSNVVHADRPEVYSFRNLQDEGLVHLAPVPSTGVIADYTLTLEYYRRIPLPSETGQLLIFQEAENTLLWGAKMRFAQEVMGMDAPDVATFAALYTSAEEKLQALDRRHPDEAPRFRLRGRPFGPGAGRRAGTGIMYIRI